MLRVLHTSDWHLGHTLHGRDRRFEHQRFLAWLLDALVDRRVDALIVAGDVFETANPSAAALADLNDFIAEARRRLPDLDIVIIAGNHDSGLRFDALAPLMAFARVHVVGHLPRLARAKGEGQGGQGKLDLDRMLVPLHDKDKAVAAWVAAVPFLRVSDLPRRRELEATSTSGDGPKRGPEGSEEDPELSAWRGDPLICGVEQVYAELLAAGQARIAAGESPAALIATGHLYMRGTALSELSERKILGGNQHAIPRGIFADPWSYVALGHLHLAQAVEQSEQVRYCGSPLPLSLTEADYEHQVLLATFEGDELVVCQSLPVPRAVDVLRLPVEGARSLDEVLFELENASFDASLEPERWPWLEVRVRLDEPQPDLRARIERALRHRPVRLLKITVERGGQGGSFADFPNRRDLDRIDPQQVFVDCYERAYGSPPDAELLEAFHELREALGRGEALAATLPPPREAGSG